MTVGELLARVDSAELTEWMAFMAIQNAPAEKPMSEEEAWKRAFNAYG